MCFRSAKLIVAATILLVLLFPVLGHSSQENATQNLDGVFTVDLVHQIKKAVVFFGKIAKDPITDEKKPRFNATGFLVKIENVFHIVTAKHVIIDQETGKVDDSGILVFFNSKDGTIDWRSIEQVKKAYMVDWVFHENKKVDIAMIPFALNLEKDDVKVIHNDMFLGTDKLFELYDVFFLSYQPGIEPKINISPILRGGIISIVNVDKTFYIDGAAFPGNSGSPVFLKPSPIRFDEKGGISIGGDSLGGKFIGLIGSYLPYREVAISIQTKRPRVIFEENTGLSKVWSVEFIEEIIESNTFKEQLQRLTK